METKVNYTIVGIFMLLLVAAIAVISIWLTVGLGTEDYKTYIVYMNESVAGLSQDAPVKYNGVTVGTVTDIELNLKNPRQVILTLSIDPAVPITQTTRAILMEQGITGIAFIGLTTGEPAPLLTKRPGEKYPVIPSTPSFLVKLDTTIENLSNSFNDMSDSVKAMLSEQNVKNMQQTLVNIQKITSAIAANSNNISQSLKDLKILMKNAAVASKQFPAVMNSISVGAESMQKLSVDLRATSKNINKTAEQGNIAIQTFSNNIVPETYDTLKDIKNASKSINGLASELKENPSMIIKGKAVPTPGPGE